MNETENRLYNDLAWLWPLWGAPSGDYARWCAQVTRMIEKYANRPLRTILNMGCGGGKNAYNLKGRYAVTGTDLSPHMLELARQLNPECRFIQADMRQFELGETFDAILVDDAISYMTSLEELSGVFAAADRHLVPGGVLIVTPDETRESFRQNYTEATLSERDDNPWPGQDWPADLEVAFIENYYDPDPSDSAYEATFLYLIRQAGQLRIESDRHILGLFSLVDWRELLRIAGFTLHEEKDTEFERLPPIFVCLKA